MIHATTCCDEIDARLDVLYRRRDNAARIGARAMIAETEALIIQARNALADWLSLPALRCRLVRGGAGFRIETADAIMARVVAIHGSSAACRTLSGATIEASRLGFRVIDATSIGPVGHTRRSWETA